MTSFPRDILQSMAQLAIDHLHHGVCLFDQEGRVMTMNRRFAEMYNPSVDVTKTLPDYLRDAIKQGSFEGDPDAFSEDILSTMRAGKTLQRMHEYPDGRIMLVTDTPVEGVGFLTAHEDVTERVLAERSVAYMARHDLLTNLANRSVFEEELSNALEAQAERGERFALFFVDLDRFKNINDEFGHAIGDAYLKEIANRLQDSSGGAFVARLGGDEFAIIQREQPQPHAASALAAALQERVAGAIRIGNCVFHAGLSVGVAVYPEDGRDAATLINHADAAMYRVKQDGRGATCFFEAEMGHSARENRILERDLHGAADRGELLLHYQPLATTGGTVTGFEALVRWQHPTLGLLPPARFLALAERNGAILEIGEWVLREACRAAATWDSSLQVAVNLSAAQLKRCDLPRLVAEILQETGLSARRLELELTESTLINDCGHSIDVLSSLKQLGIKIALDDFGTGYSSLAYLRTFPFDRLKIDRSFIADIAKSRTTESIVSGVINLAHSLNLLVTAEGVETNEQLEFLVNERCNEVQGFHIGHPRPILEHSALLEDAGPRDQDPPLTIHKARE